MVKRAFLLPRSCILPLVLKSRDSRQRHKVEVNAHEPRVYSRGIKASISKTMVNKEDDDGDAGEEGDDESSARSAASRLYRGPTAPTSGRVPARSGFYPRIIPKQSEFYVMKRELQHRWSLKLVPL